MEYACHMGDFERVDIISSSKTACPHSERLEHERFYIVRLTFACTGALTHASPSSYPACL